MGDLLELPARTYRAELFEVRWETGRFAVAGTLDGFIDLACPNAGTYVLNIEEARRLAEALSRAISDVQDHCMYDRDALL